MKKAKLLVTLATLSMLGFSSFAVESIQVKGDEVTADGLNLEETYNLGDYIYISKDATLSNGDKNVKVVSSYLIYPNGVNTASSSYKLDSLGKYKLVLLGEEGIQFEKEFCVYKDMYSFQGDKSSISYGSLNKNFSADGYGFGLKLNMTEGDTFAYASPINLFESKYQKLIAWNVIDLKTMPTVHQINVRFTDAYDPNNYFTITNSKGSYYYENYVSASYNGSRNAGLISDDAGNITVEGSSYKINSLGGAPITGNSPVSKNYNNLTYYLDSSNPEKLKIYADNDAAREHVLVTEFNNPGIYESTFSGFKNGLAFVSISASGYSGIEKATFEIGTIGGVRGDDLVPMDYYKDNNAPLIDVASKEKADIMGGVELKLPEAKAVDDTGLKEDAKCSVWYAYDSSLKRMVGVRNGAFTPDQLGVYTLLYEASDVYGNVARKRIDLNVSSFGTSGIDFEVFPLTDFKAGTTIQFNNFKAVSLNDDCEVEAEVTFPNGEKKIFSSIDLVKLECSGTYKVKYAYKDSFYAGETSYIFEVADNNVASFENNNVALPHYFMKNSSYTLDIPKAYTYGKNGAKLDDVEAFAKFDGGEYAPIDYKNVTITGSKNVQFKIAPKTNPTSFIETEVIDIIDTGFDGKKVDLTKYFVGDFEGRNELDSNGKNAEYVRYQSQKEGNGSLEFINKLLFSSFSFNFKTSGFGKLNLTLTSIYDENVQIKIELTSNTVTVNGRSLPTTENFNNSGASIIYSSTISTLSVAGASFEISNPFENDFFLLDLEAEGLTTSSYIDISMVGNQPFRSNSTRDRVAPMTSAVFPEKVGYIGDVVTLSRPSVADVLTPISDANIRLDAIKNVGGNITNLKDKNTGKTIKDISDYSTDYEIELDEYGSYIFIYSVVDGVGNTISGGLRNMTSVLDFEAPTITTKFGTLTIKANVESDLVNVEATDNLTASSDLEIWHLIYDANGILVASKENGKKVTISNKGKYDVYVTCQDEEGNVAYGQYTLIVE